MRAFLSKLAAPNKTVSCRARHEAVRSLLTMTIGRASEQWNQQRGNRDGLRAANFGLSKCRVEYVLNIPRPCKPWAWKLWLGIVIYGGVNGSRCRFAAVFAGTCVTILIRINGLSFLLLNASCC